MQKGIMKPETLVRNVHRFKKMLTKDKAGEREGEKGNEVKGEKEECKKWAKGKRSEHTACTHPYRTLQM